MYRVRAHTCACAYLRTDAATYDTRTHLREHVRALRSTLVRVCVAANPPAARPLDKRQATRARLGRHAFKVPSSTALLPIPFPIFRRNIRRFAAAPFLLHFGERTRSLSRLKRERRAARLRLKSIPRRVRATIHGIARDRKRLANQRINANIIHATGERSGTRPE